MLWLVGGFVSMFLLSLIDYHVLLDIAHLGLRVLPGLAGRQCWSSGPKVLGARRWIRLPGGIHFSPRNGSS